MNTSPTEYDRDLRTPANPPGSHTALARPAATEPVSYSLPKTNASVLELLATQLEIAKRVLDIGAGEGYLARRVKEYIDEHGLAAHLEACDLFPENFRVPDVECHGIDLHGGLPFPDQCIDLAYSVEVLEHLEDQFAFLREVHRVLRPGGHFVLTTPNVLNLTSRLRTLLVGFPELFGPLSLHGSDPQHLGGHVHPVSVYYISYMAEKAGFGVAGCHIDRVKRSSVVALVLWPLIALASRYARIGMRRRSPVATAENEAHLDRLNSLPVLTGRTIVLDLVRR